MYIIKIARTKRERVQCASNWKQTSAAETTGTVFNSPSTPHQFSKLPC